MHICDPTVTCTVHPLGTGRYRMSINDLIETEVVVSVFTREVSKTLGILPIDITLGSKTALSTSFVIDSTTNYNILLGRDWIHANWCVSSYLHQFLLFWKGN